MEDVVKNLHGESVLIVTIVHYPFYFCRVKHNKESTSKLLKWVPSQKQSFDKITSGVNLLPFALCGFHSLSGTVFLILGLIVGGKICDGYLTIPGADLTQFTYIMLSLITSYLGFVIFLFSFPCNTENLSTDGSSL